MIKEELEMLNGHISQLETAIIQYGETHDSNELYGIIDIIHALYHLEIPEIANVRDEIDHFPGIIDRGARTILELLKRFYVKENNSYEMGIMPITLENLSCCPKAQKVYKSGILKYSQGHYDRNVLDDMRLALELLIKQYLHSEKSLENLMTDLCTKLKDKGIKPELRNLLWKEIDYLCNYNNSYVKHDDIINSDEMEFIIEQTSAVINFIIHLSDEYQ